ncbi:MAG: hypothetical protein ACTHM6_12490 [Tepidisphaeraceae bacterium]
MPHWPKLSTRDVPAIEDKASLPTFTRLDYAGFIVAWRAGVLDAANLTCLD